MQFSVPESKENDFFIITKTVFFWYIPASRRACQAGIEPLGEQDLQAMY
jgi:hypothetical protein